MKFLLSLTILPFTIFAAEERRAPASPRTPTAAAAAVRTALALSPLTVHLSNLSSAASTAPARSLPAAAAAAIAPAESAAAAAATLAASTPISLPLTAPAAAAAAAAAMPSPRTQFRTLFPLTIAKINGDTLPAGAAPDRLAYYKAAVRESMHNNFAPLMNHAPSRAQITAFENSMRNLAAARARGEVTQIIDRALPYRELFNPNGAMAKYLSSIDPAFAKKRRDFFMRPLTDIHHNF